MKKSKWSEITTRFKEMNTGQKLFFAGLCIIIGLLAYFAFDSGVRFVREFQNIQKYVKICVALLFLFMYPVYYPLYIKTVHKDQELKQIRYAGEEMGQQLEGFEFTSLFYYISEIMKSMSSIVFMMFIFQIMMQVPEYINGDLVGRNQIYVYFFSMILYSALIILPMVLMLSDSVIILNTKYMRNRKINRLKCKCQFYNQQSIMKTAKKADAQTDKKREHEIQKLQISIREQEESLPEESDLQEENLKTQIVTQEENSKESLAPDQSAAK